MNSACVLSDAMSRVREGTRSFVPKDLLKETTLASLCYDAKYLWGKIDFKFDIGRNNIVFIRIQLAEAMIYKYIKLQLLEKRPHQS